MTMSGVVGDEEVGGPEVEMQGVGTDGDESGMCWLGESLVL